ncbi:MAG: divergent polysaccharide deacetylase family protein [Chitinispirillaceae bacterium]|nr:divergent polysaccharide deacetylase family protein [Chitinispirillaceae bacterium]
MRIHNVLLLAFTSLCAGGGVYMFTSGTYRHVLSAASDLIPEPVSKLVRKPRGTSVPAAARVKKRPGRSSLENNILDRLSLLEIDDSSVSFRKLPDDDAVEIRAAVPRGKPVEWIAWHLSSAASGTPYRVEDCSCSPDDRGISIVFAGSRPQERTVHLTVSWASRYFSATAKMAFLIKDFGFTADQKTIEYLSFPEPLTVALLPSRKLSSWTAQISNEYKKEIIILQPMEPCLVPRSPDGRKTQCVMLHFTEPRVRSIIADAAEAVPNFSGFINLGGTRALEDSRLTGILFSEIKKRHGYFIEDRKSRKSVAASAAEKISLPFGAIGCSIDSALDVSGIEDLIRRCAMEAQKRGHIIVCSRGTTAFIRALKKQLPLLRQNGIRLCYVSEIVVPDKKK